MTTRMRRRGCLEFFSTGDCERNEINFRKQEMERLPFDSGSNGEKSGEAAEVGVFDLLSGWTYHRRTPGHVRSSWRGALETHTTK
jgi:hypothetical protein